MPSSPRGKSEAVCAVLPPRLARELVDGSECPLPRDGHTTHRTTTPDGKTWEWDGFTCAFPDDCQYDGDSDCCISYGETPRRETEIEQNKGEK